MATEQHQQHMIHKGMTTMGAWAILVLASRFQKTKGTRAPRPTYIGTSWRRMQQPNICSSCWEILHFTYDLVLLHYLHSTATVCANWAHMYICVMTSAMRTGTVYLYHLVTVLHRRYSYLCMVVSPYQNPPQLLTCTKVHALQLVLCGESGDIHIYLLYTATCTIYKPHTCTVRA